MYGKILRKKNYCNKFYDINFHCICGVILGVLAFSVVDHWFQAPPPPTGPLDQNED